MPTPKSKLSKFILSLPSTLTGAEVVAQAKAKGMKTSGANVYRVRGLYGASAKATPTKSAVPASKPPTPATSKSDFIRHIPVSTSAKDVVAQGKAAGLKFDSDYVYKVRREAKKGALKPASPTPKRAAPKTPAKPSTSKAAFVRARTHLSPKEIVEDAKAAGIQLGTHYVYRVRGADKVTRRDKRAAAKRTTSKLTSVNGAARPVTSSAPSSSIEELLRAAAAELGLGRALGILEGERARVRAVIGA